MAARIYLWDDTLAVSFQHIGAPAILRLSASSIRGGNVHFGGFVGYSSGKVTSSLNKPPSQMVFSLPGTPQSHFLRSIIPLAPRIGFAKKPKG